jgi:hypothetical protein
MGAGLARSYCSPRFASRAAMTQIDPVAACREWHLSDKPPVVILRYKRVGHSGKPTFRSNAR